MFSESAGLVQPDPNIMDCCQAVAGYLTKMVTAGDSSTGSSSAKMKILLLDSETVRV